jgi:hypothetical protein
MAFPQMSSPWSNYTYYTMPEVLLLIAVCYSITVHGRITVNYWVYIDTYYMFHVITVLYEVENNMMSPFEVVIGKFSLYLGHLCLQLWRR